MMSYCLLTVTHNTSGKPPMVSTHLQCKTVSSNCCHMFDKTSHGRTPMAVTVTVCSLAFPVYICYNH